MLDVDWLLQGGGRSQRARDVEVCVGVEDGLGFVVNCAACSKDGYIIASGAVRVCLFLQLVAESDEANSLSWEHEFVDLESELGRQFKPESSSLLARFLLGCDG